MPDSLDRIDDLLRKTERIFRAAWLIIFAIVGGALWVASAQWSIADHERRITSVEGDVKPMSEAMARVKGHLGITSLQLPPATSRLVWTEDQLREEQRAEEEQATH